jgi:hypothetical protein
MCRHPKKARNGYSFFLSKKALPLIQRRRRIAMEKSTPHRVKGGQLTTTILTAKNR